MNDSASLFTIDGTVIDPQGDPRPDVRLVATDLVDGEQRRPQVLVSGVSDTKGSFSLGLSTEQALRLFRSGADKEEGATTRPFASRARRVAIVAYASGVVVGRLDLSITLDGLAEGYQVELRTTSAGATVSMERGAHRVLGVLRDTQRKPLAGYRIEVLHQRCTGMFFTPAAWNAASRRLSKVNT